MIVECPWCKMQVGTEEMFGGIQVYEMHYRVLGSYCGMSLCEMKR